MKKLFILCFICLLIFRKTPIAQYVRLGVMAENGNSELLATDPVADNHHYRGAPFKMKKGQACLFLMNTKSFKPRIALGSSSGMIAPIGGKETDSSAEITWITPADTSISVYFTSVEDNKIGKFNYGFRLIDSSQLIFKDDYSTCDRLIYLINHWQLNWMLVPTEVKQGVRKFFPLGAYDYYAFKNMLLKSSKSEFTDKYQETLFSVFCNSQDGKKKVTEFYKKICEDIKACLNKNDWNIEPENEILLGESIPSIIISVSSYFILKGAAKEEHLKSFKIMIKSPYLDLSMESEDQKKYEVLLIFN